MGRLLDEDDVIGALMEQFKRNTPIAIRAKLTVEALPPAQPERKKGKWILVTDNNGQHYECSQCGAWRYHQEQFCGSCGADMR